MDLVYPELSEQIIASAIAAHKELGPGLLESVYEACFCHELSSRGLGFERQKRLPIVYKGTEIEGDFKLDVLVEDLVVVELKAVEKILPIHEAQVLTYLKLSHKKLGLLMNFNVPLLKDGLKGLVL